MLATEATALAHGHEAAKAAAETARQTFEEGETGEGLPTVTISAADLDRDGGMASYSLVAKVDPSLSNSAARRLIKGGGVRIQGDLITDELHRITSDTADSSGSISVQLGRKKHFIVKVTD
jgi:tyrosyl-tRNA synthetase